MLQNAFSHIPVNTIDTDHCYDLKKGDDQQWDGPHIAVEYFQPVVSRAQTEDQGDSEGNQAYETCKENYVC